MRNVVLERLLSPFTELGGWFEGEYGSYRLASSYCGFRRPVRQVPGVWQHGWAPEHYNVDLEVVVGTDGRAAESRERGKFYVARGDQVEFLRSCGVRHVHAIGLPIVYTTESRLSRIKGSLLVVPVHSASQTQHSWNFDEYASEIKRIANTFSNVTVCVHASCVEKGYWIDAFDRYEIPWVVGADYANANTLSRVRDLFSMFEFVTTNGFGSHMAYAAAFGAKVSIWGPMARYDFADMKNDTLTKNAPNAMAHLLEFSSESFLRNRYPEFFTAPWDAPIRVEWGRSEIGWGNRKSPRELRRILGWDLKTRIFRGVAGRFKKVLKLTGR